MAATTTKTRTPAKPASFNETLLEVVSELRARIYRYADDLAGGLAADDLADRLGSFDLDAARATTDALVETVKAIEQRVQTAQANDGRPQMVARGAIVGVDNLFTVASNNSVDDATLLAVHDAEHTVEKIQSQQVASLAELKQAVELGDVDAVMRVRPDVEVTLPSQLDEAQVALLDAQIVLHHQAAKRASELATIADRQVSIADDNLDKARTVYEAAQLDASVANGAKLATDQSARQASFAHANTIRARDALALHVEAERTARFRRLAGLPDDISAEPAAATTSAQPGPSGERHEAPVAPPSGFLNDTYIDRTPFTPTEFRSVADYFTSGV